MKDLTKGNPLKLIFEFAIPVLIGNVLQLLYSLIDTRIVGETLGNTSLAAVGSTSAVNTLIVGFLLGLTNGFAILTAREYGADNMKRLKKTVASSVVLGLVISVLLTIISITFLYPLLTLLNTPENVIDEAYKYIVIIFAGMTISMLYNVCASVLRAIGDTVTPLIFLGVSTVLNVILDLFFIRVLNMGVEGAAYATIISQAFSAVTCFIYMNIRYEILRLRREDFIFDNEIIKHLLSSGFSMGFMLSIVSLGTVSLQGAINRFGEDIIVAHTAARKITEIFMLMFGVLGTTMATYCSQNLGAGEVTRIKIGIKKVIIITWIWSACMILISYTVAPMLIRLITSSDKEEIIHTASLYLRIDTLFYFVPAMITIIRNSMQGIGDHVTPIFSSTIELVGKFLIAIFLAPKMGYMGIIIAEPIVWILMVVPLIVQILRNPVLKDDTVKA